MTLKCCANLCLLIINKCNIMKNTDTSIMSNTCDSVVNKSSENTYIDFLDYLKKNTISSNNYFYQGLDSCAFIDNKPIDIIKKKDNVIIFSVNGLVNKIELFDAPISQYILNINGHNIMTATYDKNKKCYYFDLSIILKNEYSHLALLSKNYMEEDEPFVENRIDFLNLNCVDRLKIIMPKNLIKINEKIQIISHGYFKNENNWSEFTQQCITNYPHYDNHNILIMNYPTDSIDITVTGHGTLIILINGFEYETLSINNKNSHFLFHRIKLKNPEQKLLGTHNLNLSEEINKNTINMSRVDTFEVISINCKVTKVSQNYYKIYNYPTMTIKYAN